MTARERAPHPLMRIPQQQQQLRMELFCEIISEVE